MNYNERAKKLYRKSGLWPTMDYRERVNFGRSVQRIAGKINPYNPGDCATAVMCIDVLVLRHGLSIRWHPNYYSLGHRQEPSRESASA